ncbi:MAG: hypothetical protein GY811_31095 [Myxococcales bacterium]|nr:hypothetical protein [Myxococcales bacterium]
MIFNHAKRRRRQMGGVGRVRMKKVLVPWEDGSNRHIGYGLQLFVHSQKLVFMFDSRVFTKEQATKGLEFYLRVMEEGVKQPALPIAQLIEL